MSQPIDADKLYAHVWQLRREDKLPEALAITSAALTALRQGGDPKSMARVLCVMGQLKRDRGHSEEAAAFYGEAAALYRALPDQAGLAYAVRRQCDILRELGRLAEAERLGAEGLAAYRAMQASPLDLANMLRVYGVLKEDLGQREEARQLWAEAGELHAAARVQAGINEAKRRGDSLG